MDSLALAMTHQPGGPIEPPKPSAFKRQEGGEHYSSLPQGYQPFQISHALKLDPMQHTILKYVLRHKAKNGLQDLLKARHTLDILIELEYGNGQQTPQN